MTKQEAITRLSMIFANCDTEMCKGAYVCKYCDEALNMAIEALKQEPIIHMSKYIKLEDAKKIIMDGVCTDTDADKEYVCDLLSNLPTIEVSEDLISRQDAIDALVRSSVYAWSVEEDQTAHEWALKIIGELPAKG